MPRVTCPRVTRALPGVSRLVIHVDGLCGSVPARYDSFFETIGSESRSFASFAEPLALVEEVDDEGVEGAAVEVAGTFAPAERSRSSARALASLARVAAASGASSLRRPLEGGGVATGVPASGVALGEENGLLHSSPVCADEVEASKSPIKRYVRCMVPMWVTAGADSTRDLATLRA